MIYEAVAPDEPIRQGDIFRNIPRVDFSLAALPVMESDGGEMRLGKSTPGLTTGRVQPDRGLERCTGRVGLCVNRVQTSQAQPPTRLAHGLRQGA